MKIIRTAAAAAFALAALTACGEREAEENEAANIDANAMMPADNLTVDANNVTVVDNAADMNMTNMDMNATDTANTTTNNGY